MEGRFPPRAARKAAARRRRLGLLMRRWALLLAAVGGAGALLQGAQAGVPGWTLPWAGWLAGALGAPAAFLMISALRMPARPVERRDRRLPVIPLPGAELAAAAGRAGGAVWRPPEGTVGLQLPSGPAPGRVAEEAERAPAAVGPAGLATPLRAQEALVAPAGGRASRVSAPSEGGEKPPDAVGGPPAQVPGQGASASAPGEAGTPPAPAGSGTPAAPTAVAAPADQPPARAVAAPAPAPVPPARRPRLGRLAQRRTVLGLDVGTYSTKVVQVRRGRRGFTVVNFWDFRTPQGAVAEGAPAKPEVLSARLAQLVAEFRLRGRPAVSFLGAQKALARVVRFPPMTAEEVAGALRWEAENYIPLPAEAAVTDFLMGGLTADGREMEVLVVAAPREAVDALAAGLRSAGLVPVAVEAEPLAVYRALGVLGLVPARPEEEGFTVLLDLGHAATKVSVFERGLPVATRVLRTGGGAFTEAIARGLNWPPERAEAAKRRWGVLPDTPVHPFVAGVLDALTQEIWRTLEFFLVLAKGGSVARVCLVGGNALQPGLAEELGRRLSARLGERFGLATPEDGLVRLATPGASLRLPRHLQALAAELDARYVAALGTALWRR